MGSFWPVYEHAIISPIWEEKSLDFTFIHSYCPLKQSSLKELLLPELSTCLFPFSLKCTSDFCSITPLKLPLSKSLVNSTLLQPMVNSQSSSLLSYQQHVTQTLPFLLPIRISGSLGFSTSLISPSQPFWLVHPPLLDSLMLKCAKAQSLALFPSPSKSTPWWSLLVHSCKYHVLADNHQLCIYRSNFSLKIFRCIFSTVYWVSVLGYPVSIIFSTLSTLNSKSVSANNSTFPGKWNERPALRWAVHSEEAEWEQIGWSEGYIFFSDYYLNSS